MSWDKEWSAIEQQIQELDRLCTDAIGTFRDRPADPYSVVTNIIFPVCSSLRERLTTYKSRYFSILPENAINTIDVALSDLGNRFPEGRKSTYVEPSSLFFYKETFNKLRFDFNYFVNELEGSVYRQSERAFLHLQRSLAVNEEDRNRWREAFKHETRIEALGAVHLLSHGIWAFKIDSGGQRTDLVFQEPLTRDALRSIGVATDGLVLTEWKLVKNEGDTVTKSEEAFKQAAIYGAESLAETELTRYRYLILVSLKRLTDMPKDFDEKGVRYRHINIAIDIESPSIRSRKILK